MEPMNLSLSEKKFKRFLNVAPEKITIGEALKALVQYQHKETFDWAATDVLLFSVWTSTVTYPQEGFIPLLGFLGLQKQLTKKVMGITLERVLDERSIEVLEDIFDSDTLESTEFHNEWLNLHFWFTTEGHFSNTELAKLDAEQNRIHSQPNINSHDYPNIEAFLEQVFQHPAFQQLALLQPTQFSIELNDQSLE